MKKRVEIPTVTIPVGRPAPAPAPAPKKVAKAKARTKTQRPKAKVAKAKERVKVHIKKPRILAKPDISQVPASLAPPEIRDSRPKPGPVARQVTRSEARPVPVPEPLPQPEPGPEQEPLSVPVAAARTDIPAKPEPPKPVDTRLVQGSQCTWVGTLEDAPDDPDSGQPVCPHCHGRLITCPDRSTMELGFEAFEMGAYASVNPPPRPHPGYREFVHWMLDQGREQCWTTIGAAADAYHTSTGKRVDTGE